MYDYLVGLNQEYDQIRIQILGKEKVPRLNEVMVIIHSEERRSLMLETPVAESSDMIVEGAITIVTDKGKVVLFQKWRRKMKEHGVLIAKSHAT